jgi:hypothetical protein
MSRCCPHGTVLLEILAGAEKRVLDRADRRAAELGDGAHVHVLGDDVIVVRAERERVLVAYGEAAYLAAFGK